MSEKNIRITDMREWIFEAVEKIGAPVQYIQRESGADGCPIFQLQQYQIPIPEDLESLTAVAYSTGPEGPWIPVRKDESTFREPRTVLLRDDTIEMGPGYDKHNMVIDDPNTNVYHEGDHIPEGIHHHPQQPMAHKMYTTKAQFITGLSHNANYAIAAVLGRKEPTYFVKPGWIVLNKPKGFVKLSYKAIATDERGYPLVPDLASYQEAIYWYVMMKLNFPKFLKGALGGKSRYNNGVYSYIIEQWNFYRNQAYAEAMMPNEGEMRTIKNEWHKLIPEWDSDDTFFKTNGERELNYTDYYYGY